MLWIAVAGVITGVLGAALGVGGGMFLIPVLVYGLHIPMHNAVATGIIAVIATSSAVTSTSVKRGMANMRLGMTLELATSAGAIVGGLLAGGLSGRTLEALFAIVLVPTVILMWRGREGDEAAQEDRPATDNNPERVDSSSQGELGGAYVDEANGQLIVYRVRRLWAGLGISFFAGGLSGLLGTGGGTIHVPGLHLACGVPLKAATATSNFMIGVTAAASAFLYFGRGQVIPGVTAAAVLGVLAGSIVGSFGTRTVHGHSLRKSFAVMLAILALYILFQVWNGSDMHVQS